jgi:hypothetical protein
LISSEISPQSCSDLQIAEGGNHYQKEDMQRPFDLQLKQQEEVFLYNFIDPFVDYLESLSSTRGKLFLLNEGWFCCPFGLHFCKIWVPAFIISRSEVSPVSQIFVWLHWKHDFT